MISALAPVWKRSLPKDENNSADRGEHHHEQGGSTLPSMISATFDFDQNADSL